MTEHTPELPRRTSAEEREARAEETLKKIVAGGDLGAESLALANDFTDEHTARLGSWFRRLFHRRPTPPNLLR